ncbi:unnamed protein product [Protopolystoma xenopodis]|uniref:RING-type domain-containing protein n=1 Tax=Protopolystoma xenopodis TaxID=117903 RepID=A0A3S5AAL8_9PLAT|nr:unnamed protein product [Protopolystoma xenopodis]
MHTFCFDCIHRWFSINPLCPLCKRLGHRLLHSIRSDAQYAELLVADIAPAAGLLGPPDGISSSAFGPSGPASAAFTGQPHTHHHYHHLHHHHFHYRRPSLVFGHEFDGPGPAADSGPPASFSPAGLTPMPTSTHSRRQTSGSTSAQLRPFLLSTTAVNITSITTTATTSLSSPSGIEVSSPSRFLTSSSSLIDFLSSRMPSSIPYVPSSESLLTPSSFASFSPPATNAAASCATTSLSLQQQQNVISSTSITSPCLAIPLAADLSHSLIRMQTDILSSNRSTTDTSSRTAQQLVRPLTDAHPPPLGSWLSASPYFPSVSSESRDSTLWSTSVRRRFATTSRIPSSLSWQLVADAILPSEPWSMDGLLLRQLVYIYPLHSYVIFLDLSGLIID